MTRRTAQAQREEEYMRVSRECMNVTRGFSLADNGGDHQEGCFEDRRVCPDSDPCYASTFLINTHTESARARERESQHTDRGRSLGSPSVLHRFLRGGILLRQYTRRDDNLLSCPPGPFAHESCCPPGQKFSVSIKIEENPLSFLRKKPLNALAYDA